MNMRQWVKLPSTWIEEGGLSAFKWRVGQGASETAALMALMVIAHRANLEDGIARATYDNLMIATGISRTKISDGLEHSSEAKPDRSGTRRSQHIRTDKLR